MFEAFMSGYFFSVALASAIAALGSVGARQMAEKQNAGEHCDEVTSSARPRELE
jgi:hypothetical protein